MGTWMTWIPLLGLAGAILVVEVGSLVLDPGFRLRRELRKDLGGVVHGIARMEVRGIRVHQLIEVAEVFRGRVLIQHLLVWIVILCLGALAAVLGWSWWTVPLLTGLLISAQTIQLSHILQPTAAAYSDEEPSRLVAKRLVHAAAIALIVGGVLLIGLGTVPTAPLTTGLFPRLLSLVAGVAVLFAAILLRRAGLRIGGTANAGARFGADSSLDDILLLRSFQDDALHIRAIDLPLAKLSLLLAHRARFEELIATTLQNAGRLIAIGKPGETVPPLGATRTYIADDHWREAIENTTRRVGMIVMIASGTSGFEWELGLIRRTNLLHKTLILLPPFGLDLTLDRLLDLMKRLEIDVLDSFEDDQFEEWGFAFISTVTGIGFTKHGKPVFYVSLGRDWLGYTATILRAFAIIRGRIKAPLHGAFAQRLGYDIQPVEQ